MKIVCYYTSIKFAWWLACLKEWWFQKLHGFGRELCLHQPSKLNSSSAAIWKKKRDRESLNKNIWKLHWMWWKCVPSIHSINPSITPRTTREVFRFFLVFLYITSDAFSIAVLIDEMEIHGVGYTRLNICNFESLHIRCFTVPNYKKMLIVDR